MRSRSNRTSDSLTQIDPLSVNPCDLTNTTPDMQHLFDKLFDKGKAKESHPPDAPPPRWTPAVEESHERGKYEDTTFDEYEQAERFCALHKVDRPRLLPQEVVERLSLEGCKPWGMRIPTSPRFDGSVESGTKEGAGVTRVVTGKRCRDVCIFSDLPIMAGLYDIKGKQGVYYEVIIRKMGGIIAIGE